MTIEIGTLEDLIEVCRARQLVISELTEIGGERAIAEALEEGRREQAVRVVNLRGQWLEYQLRFLNETIANEVAKRALAGEDKNDR